MNPVANDEALRRFLLEDLEHAEVDLRLGHPVAAAIEFEENAVLCGGHLLVPLFRLLDPDLNPERVRPLPEGAPIEAGDRAITMTLNSEALKHGIRVALNLLAHLSGIATNTCRLVERVRGSGCQLLDTRKTTPGLRAFQKYAVRVGGGRNHRFGRADGVMLKKEDIRLSGGISEAIRVAVAQKAHLTAVEVEVETMVQLRDVIADGRVRHVLLDNMTPEQVREAVDIAGSSLILEASGVKTSDLERYAATGVPFISTSALILEARPTRMHLVMGE